mmetsp:Transcript_49465/g.141531  ORF Transcript_49465/g.141531 Transcript_49465/m.141531 type:complete len:252 (+) Transcript_49465:636-1391(+)
MMLWTGSSSLACECQSEVVGVLISPKLQVLSESPQLMLCNLSGTRQASLQDFGGWGGMDSMTSRGEAASCSFETPVWPPEVMSLGELLECRVPAAGLLILLHLPVSARARGESSCCPAFLCLPLLAGCCSVPVPGRPFWAGHSLGAACPDRAPPGLGVCAAEVGRTLREGEWAAPAEETAEARSRGARPPVSRLATTSGLGFPEPGPLGEAAFLGNAVVWLPGQGPRTSATPPCLDDMARASRLRAQQMIT